jgi:endoglucanase/cellulose 1,4-beta-cellobiosidase
MPRVPRIPILLAVSLVLPAAALLIPAGAAATAPAPLPAPAAATPAPSSSGSPSPSGPGTPFPSGPTTPNTSPYPPTAPADLRATGVTSTSITLTWTASAPGCCPVDRYEITWTQAFNDVIHLENVGNVTTWTLRYAQPTGIYSFRVVALDHLGHRSGSSNSVRVVTPNADTGDVTPPSGPSDLRVTGTGPAGADLTWTGSTDDTGVTGYDVYRFDGLYISTRLATVPGTSFTARTTGRDMFYVRARDAAGNLSESSNIVTVIGGTSTPTPVERKCVV